MRTLGSSGSESSTPDKMATAASIFTEQSNLVSKCKRFEQKYRMTLEQKVLCVCLILVLVITGFLSVWHQLLFNMMELPQLSSTVIHLALSQSKEL